MIVPLPTASRSPFAGSHAAFERILRVVDSEETAALSHGELEQLLDVEGRALIRQLLQDHLDLRTQREPRVEVVDAEGVRHGSVERGHQRALTTIFGEVEVSRMAYRRRCERQPNLYPADEILNLPTEKHSHGPAQAGRHRGLTGSISRS